jgi:hypothetical protein
VAFVDTDHRQFRSLVTVPGADGKERVRPGFLLPSGSAGRTELGVWSWITVRLTRPQPPSVPKPNEKAKLCVGRPVRAAGRPRPFSPGPLGNRRGPF